MIDVFDLSTRIKTVCRGKEEVCEIFGIGFDDVDVQPCVGR